MDKRVGVQVKLGDPSTTPAISASAVMRALYRHLYLCFILQTVYTRCLYVARMTSQGRIQEFWKGGHGNGAKPRTERRRRERRRGSGGSPPENFEKLDAISCNLAYIFEIRMASDIIQSWAFAEEKTVVATISIHTHTRIHPPTLPKNSSDFGHYKIQIQFQKYFFRHCIQCKK